jgi:uncharacterized protein YndB with AHSA1/START domain
MTEPMTLRARIWAPIKDVHHALTDAAALRTWLAEYAEVDLPERYEFWGRYTPEGDAPHQRPLHVDEHTVRFSWLLDGEDTTVDIQLTEEDPESTLLTLSQTHFPGWAEAIAETSVRGVLHTYWSISVANLADYVEGRPLTPKCDFTSRRMREEVVIDAAPDAVYESLIDPEKFSRWFGVKVDIEPYVGGRFSMGGFEVDPTGAKILELEPGRRMSLAFGPIVSSWELEGSEGKTRLTFVQSGFDDTQRPPYGAWMGWLSGVAELRRFHEVPGWRSRWFGFEAPEMPDGMIMNEQTG